ncbi:hypothetical protein V8E51_019847 [Hyaloscypha variabilis]
MLQLKTLLSTLPPLEMPAPHGINLHAFALFPDLPPKIRDAIWFLASCEPRTIKLFFVENHLKGWMDKMAVPGQTRHLGIVHACHESRQAALKHYEICDAYGFGRQGGAVGFNTIYVNFSIDPFPIPNTTKTCPDFAPVTGHCTQLRTSKFPENLTY